MKLSVSNLAWESYDNDIILPFLADLGIDSIEIVPTKIVNDHPYDQIDSLFKYKDFLKKEYNLSLSSMQSILYGRNESIFGDNNQQAALVDYMGKALATSKELGIKNVVFGCPRNRIRTANESDQVALGFFEKIAAVAESNDVCVSIEPISKVYGTDFLNNLYDTYLFVEKLHSSAIAINYDFGTMIESDDKIEQFDSIASKVNHVHISEPGLGRIQNRKEHLEFAELLRKNGYHNYVSLEMKPTESIEMTKNAIEYFASVFGD